jgi:hypothetical protein
MPSPAASACVIAVVENVPPSVGACARSSETAQKMPPRSRMTGNLLRFGAPDPQTKIRALSVAELRFSGLNRWISFGTPTGQYGRPGGGTRKGSLPSVGHRRGSPLPAVRAAALRHGGLWQV